MYALPSNLTIGTISKLGGGGGKGSGVQKIEVAQNGLKHFF